MLALVALGGPAGAGIGLIFAYQRYTGATSSQVMRTRAVVSFAWGGGPPLTAFLMGFFGSRSILWAVAGTGMSSLGYAGVFAGCAGLVAAGFAVLVGARLGPLSRRPAQPAGGRRRGP